jgi:hypothetical protein
VSRRPGRRRGRRAQPLAVTDADPHADAVHLDYADSDGHPDQHGQHPTPPPTASGSPVTSKNFIFVKLGTPPTTIGQINIACSGDSIANANATTSGKGYTLTVRSTSNPQVDVFFSKN